MKKNVSLHSVAFIIFSQTKETIKFNYPVKDYTFATKSLQVIDLRKEKK